MTPGAAGGSVLVVAADTFIALTVIRSLGRKGVRVVALSSPDSLAAHSRYCAAVWPMPKKKEDLARVTLEIIEREKITHVIAASDPTILRLNRQRAELEKHATLLFPPADIAALAIHKDRTLELALGAGIPCPQSLTIRNPEDLAAARNLHFPVVVKPRHQDLIPSSAPPFKVKYCASFEELTEALAPFHKDRDYPLIQEFCPGYGVGVEVLMRAGEPVLVFQHRRVREFPVSGGVSTCCESMDVDPALRDWSVALLRAMQWEGVAMVEYRKDDASGRAVLMEVNGRFWGSVPLPVHAGCDFPFELYRTSIQAAAPPEQNSYTVGLRCRLLVAETKWLLDALRQRAMPWWRAIAQYLFAFRPGTKYYVWAWDDPRPAFAAFFFRVKRILGRRLGSGSPVT